MRFAQILQASALILPDLGFGLREVSPPWGLSDSDTVPVPVPILVESGAARVPDAYITFADGFSGDVQEGSVPVIDLLDVESGGRQRIVLEIRRASEEWGFFEVVNHGVDEAAMEGIMAAAQEFFRLPVEERMKFYSPVRKIDGTRYGTRLEDYGVQDWRDFLNVGRCYPLSEETFETWPSSPLFKDAAVKYCEQVRSLAFRLISLASESLGLDPDRLSGVFDPLGQTMLFNRYLPCPQPELVLGARSHCDPGLVNILLTDDVPGLQMRKNAESPWVAINAKLVVNFGDQMQIVTNNRYRSFEHRVVANSTKSRFSVSSFFNPGLDTAVGPLPELVDEDHPCRYRQVTFGEYAKLYVARRLSKGTPEALEIKN